MKIIVCLLFLCAHTWAIKKQISPIYTSTIQTTRKFEHFGNSIVKDIECDPDYKYRSLDGSCNNLEHPTWGMLNSKFVRLFEANYADGVELPPIAADGSELPNARHIVLNLFSEDKNFPDNVSLIVAQWAQFVAHDFAANVPKQGVSDCCASDDQIVCLPIMVPEDDSCFIQYNKTCIALTRTEKVDSVDGSKIPINGVSHGLDASQVYGSDDESASSLREHEGGRLLMRTISDGRCFLPSDPNGHCYMSDVCYVAGESRVNQNTQLTIMHTLFVRGHNTIAGVLTEMHPEWDDELTYQEARKIVIAIYLHITYNGFLPYIITEEIANKHNLKSFLKNYKYDPLIPNSVIVSFANPAFRIFHSALQGVIALFDYHLKPTSYINLTDYMNSPGILEEDEKFDELILGVITQPMQIIDPFYTQEIQQKLFHFANPYGTDLNSLDIQRARDHGVPTYPTLVEGCLHVDITDFDDLTDMWPEDKIELVKQLYKSVEDIDLFVAINFENKLPGHRMSPIAECLITEQFYRWKTGDRFWYEILDEPHSFTSEQLDEIKKVTLSRLVCDTSDNIVNITTNAWVPPSDSNPIVPCDEIPAIDFTKWM